MTKFPYFQKNKPQKTQIAKTSIWVFINHYTYYAIFLLSTKASSIALAN